MRIKRIEIPTQCDYLAFLENLSFDLAGPEYFNDVKPFFKGTIESKYFKIQENILSKGIEPIIVGYNVKDENGSRLIISIHLNLISIAIVAALLFAFLYYSLKSGFDFISISLIVFGIAMSYYQIQRDTKRLLDRIHLIVSNTESANI